MRQWKIGRKARGMERHGRNADPDGSWWRKGLGAVWPICVGYVPLGLAFGVLAEKAGLSPLEIGFMSFFVFAGSGQFIAVSMLSGGASVLAIVATTFMVNLRHFLMSSSLAIRFRGRHRGWLTLLSAWIVDETFAVNIERLDGGRWGLRRSLVVGGTAWAAWAVSTTLGGYCGSFIPEGAFGIDYALIGMFICLLVYQLKGRIACLSAVVAGSVGTAVALLLPGNGYIIAGAVAGATAGLFVKRCLARADAEVPA